MLRFLLLFCGVLGSLFAIEMLKPVQEALIQPFTGLLAALSTAIILPFDDNVIAQGRILRDATTGFAVSIEAGCNGVEAAIVLIAGIVAFPAASVTKWLPFWPVSCLCRFSISFASFRCFTWVNGITPSLSGSTSTFGPCLIMLDVLLCLPFTYSGWAKSIPKSSPPDAHAPPIRPDPDTDAYHVWHLVRSGHAVCRSRRLAV